jgi:hypothetical protein
MYKFWISEMYGLIRQQITAGGMGHPEIWTDGCWHPGSPYVMDAITGLGEDLWSCGESADDCDQATAEEYADQHGIDLSASASKT